MGVLNRDKKIFAEVVSRVLDRCGRYDRDPAGYCLCRTGRTAMAILGLIRYRRRGADDFPDDAVPQVIQLVMIKEPEIADLYFTLICHKGGLWLARAGQDTVGVDFKVYYVIGVVFVGGDE
jgi:hypothetical protein